MKTTKKILALVILVCSLTSGFTIIWIAQAQPSKMSKLGDFEATSPYTFQLENVVGDNGAEISDWGVTVIARLTATDSSRPGDIVEIILWDLTDDKKADSIMGQGPQAVATLVETDLEPDHEYEVRITTVPDEKHLTGTIEYEWVETQKKSGIPGFNTESVILGLLSATVILWVLKKNQ